MRSDDEDDEEDFDDENDEEEVSVNNGQQIMKLKNSKLRRIRHSTTEQMEM
jgi:hypothetical protein